MTDDLAGLVGPSAISKVGPDLPRRDQPPPRQRQQAQKRQAPVEHAARHPVEPGEPCLLGSRLDVQA